MERAGLSVHRRHHLAQPRHDGGGIAFHPQIETLLGAAAPELPEGHIHAGPQRAHGIVVAMVLDQTHDGSPRAPEPHAPSYRIRSLEVAPGKGLVHNQHAWGTLAAVLGEVAAFGQRNPQ